MLDFKAASVTEFVISTVTIIVPKTVCIHNRNAMLHHTVSCRNRIRKYNCNVDRHRNRAHFLSHNHTHNMCRLTHNCNHAV